MRNHWDWFPIIMRGLIILGYTIIIIGFVGAFVTEYMN